MLQAGDIVRPTLQDYNDERTAKQEKDCCGCRTSLVVNCCCGTCNKKLDWACQVVNVSSTYYAEFRIGKQEPHIIVIKSSTGTYVLAARSTSRARTDTHPSLVCFTAVATAAAAAAVVCVAHTSAAPGF